MNESKDTKDDYYVMRERLTHLMAMANLHFDDERMKLFEQFLQNVELMGTPLGLTEAKGDTLIVDHLIDSLSACVIISTFSLRTLADVGSGAGFPGLALAIAMPALQVTLIERMEKRARFLQMMVAKLHLTNVKVIHGDIKNVKEIFDAITFRALSQMNGDLASLLLQKSPLLLAYKGRLASVNEEMSVLEECGFRCDVQSLVLPNQKKERNLLIIRTKDKD